MKNLLILLGALLIGGKAIAGAALPQDIMNTLLQAQSEAQAALNQGDDSQLVPSQYLQGNWMFVKRMCVTGLSQSEIDNPTSVAPNTDHRVIVSQFINSRQSDVITQDGNPDYSQPGDVCTMTATSRYSSAHLEIPVPGTNLTLEDVFVQSQTSAQGTATCGPSSVPHTRWKFGTVVSVLKIDQNNAYFFLAPGQLAGTTSSCPNNGFNLDLIERLVN